MFTNRNLLQLLLLILLLASSAEARERKDKRGKKGKKEAARAEVIHAKSPKHEIDFSYYVPVACHKKKNVPLVVSYHGAGGSGQGEIRGWTKLAEEHGFIVACPTSILAGHGHKAGQAMPVSPPQFTKETEAVLSIVAMLTDKYSIDRRKVMVTGFSGGGNPSYWLGLLYPQVFPFLCTRCGNWPTLLSRVAAQNEDAGKATRYAAAHSYIYIYWGERDHPIIRGTINMPLEFVEGLKPVHYKKEKIPGMGHSSTPGRAASWFVEAMAEAEKVWAAQAKEKHAKLLEAAGAAKESKDTAKAIEQLKEAIELEELYKKLGKDASRALRKIDSEGSKWLMKARGLAASKDPKAVKALRYVADNYKGTKSGNKAADALAKFLKAHPDLAKEEAPAPQEKEKAE